MAYYEIILAIISILITAFFYATVIDKGNHSLGKLLVLMFCICPIVFWSVNMVGDTITADEYQYMKTIVDMPNIIKDPGVAAKLMLQYRTSQMFLGTIFKMIPQKIYDQLSLNSLLIIYKILHWILFYIIGLLICIIVYKKYLNHNSENGYKRVLAWIVTFYMVMGLPMTISVMKVCNYDATNVMFATLGITLIGAYVLGVVKKNF